MRHTAKTIYIASFVAALSINTAYADIHQALQATIQNHPMITGKQAEVMAKQYQLQATESLYYPNVSLNSSYRLDKAQDNSNTYNRVTTLGVEQPLWTFGKTESQIDYAQNDKLFEEADFVRVKQSLLKETALAYADVQGLLKRKQAVLDNIQEYESLIQQVERRQKMGMMNKSDVNLSSARLLQEQNTLNRLLGDLKVAEETLLKYTQIPVSTDTVVDKAQFKPLSEQVLENLLDTAAADVLVKQQAIELAKTEVERQKTQIYPTLSVSVQQDILQDQDYETDSNRISLNIRGQLNQLGFANLNQTKASQQSLLAAKADLQSTQNDLLRRAQTLHKQLGIQKQLVKLTTESISELAQTYDSYHRQYKAGRKSWLEVLNMQRELQEQKLLKIDIDNQWLKYRLELAALYGELEAWVNE